MSDHSTKLEQQRSTEGPARRTYASLEAARGFTWGKENVTSSSQAPLAVRRHIAAGEAIVSICPLNERTCWRHVGGGKWNSAGALYEKVEGE
jgi:hypothetical protein